MPVSKNDREMLREITTNETDKRRYRQIFRKIRRKAQIDFGLEPMGWIDIHGDSKTNTMGDRFSPKSRENRKKITKLSGAIRVGADPGRCVSKGAVMNMRVLVTMRRGDVSKLHWLAAASGFDTAGEYLHSLIEADIQRCRRVREERNDALKRAAKARKERKAAREKKSQRS